jgi:coenzyme F420-reducing hydrogenase beta subunit
VRYNQGNFYQRAYAARAKSKDLLLNSSSGGIFPVLSDYILDCGGVVYSAGYDFTNNIVIHRKSETKEERNSCCGSKYLQSDMQSVYSEIKKLLRANVQVLFVGTPCQVGGLKGFLGRNDKNKYLITCDIICHGVVSPAIWNQYAKNLCKKHNGNISRIAFREKRENEKRTRSVIYIDNKSVSIRPYGRLFNTDLFVRKSCYKCPYADINRASDITIGDYWGLEKVRPDFYSDIWGNSLILVNSIKGEELLSNSKYTLDLIETPIKFCLQRNLKEPTKCPEDRDKAWKVYFDKGLDGILEKYAGQGLTGVIRLCFKRLLRR